MAPVTSLPSPPDAGATQIAFWLDRAPPCGCQYATLLPSGEKTGWLSSIVWVVSRRVAPVATSTSATWATSGVFSWGVSRCVMAMVFPSGDQDSGEGAGPGGCATGRLQGPLVTRRASPPSADTIQTCEGVGATVVRKSSSPTSNAL